MPKIQTFNAEKKPTTDIGEQIVAINLDELVFSPDKKGPGKIFPDGAAIVANAKQENSRFNSCAKDVEVEIRYNDNVFKSKDAITERLASKELINEREDKETIKLDTRALSKHRSVTFPVTADAICDGIALDEHYSYLLTIVNAPNAGNSKKGNGAASSLKDMQLYFSGSDTENYRKVMKEIYKNVLLAQKNRSAVVIPPIGLGVYLSNLKDQDMHYNENFVKEEIVNHKGNFTFIKNTQKLYFTDQEGVFQEIEKFDLNKVNEFLAEHKAEASPTELMHLHFGTIKSFGADFEGFVKGLPKKTDRPQETAINKANYEGLNDAIQEFENEGAGELKTIVLCTVRPEGESLFKTLEFKNIDVLQSKGDMLQTVQLIAKSNISVGLVCAGSDHDIGGATKDCLVKLPRGNIPGEEQTSLTSNMMNTLDFALEQGNVKFVSYTMDVCQPDFSQLPKQTATVSVADFSFIGAGNVKPAVDKKEEVTGYQPS